MIVPLALEVVRTLLAQRHGLLLGLLAMTSRFKALPFHSHKAIARYGVLALLLHSYAHLRVKLC